VRTKSGGISCTAQCAVPACDPTNTAVGEDRLTENVFEGSENRINEGKTPSAT
jgi:hypothetical protein